MTPRHCAAAAALALLLLAGCRQAPEPVEPAAPAGSTAAEAPATQRQPPAAASAEPAETRTACPSEDFPVFFDAFMERISVQKAFTRWPLTSITVDSEAQPEPAQVTRQIEQGQATFPLLMTAQRAAHDGLQLSVQELGEGRAIVTYAKPDTDYQLRYRFQLAGDCWQLVSVQDDSL